jgi:DNA-directed RNA polymerase specialized sigma24 family protein
MGVSPEPDHAADVLGDYAKSLIRYKAHQLCRRPDFSRSDEEDIVQELTAQVLRKAPLYDPGRGASPDTFADRVIDSAVKLLLRARASLKRSPDKPVKSLEREVVEADHSRQVSLGESIDQANATRRTGAVSENQFEAIDRADAVAHALASGRDSKRCAADSYRDPGSGTTGR